MRCANICLQLRKAIKELQALCARMRQRWDVRKVAIAHRTGVVPVGEASVVIAVSSAHRREALEATQFGIEELKATVPIWKKEVYEDGSAWKANKEAQEAVLRRTCARP